MPGLTSGRIIHYVFGNRHYAAVVTLVLGDTGTVNLYVFPDNSYPEAAGPKTSVLYSEGQESGTWHWIEEA